MQVVNKPIHSIHAYKNNPRINKDAIAYVKKSISSFGMIIPIVIDRSDEIVCGHTRYEACMQLGFSSIPCIVASELTESQVKAFRLVDNKSQEIAQWDLPKLEDELYELINQQQEISITDFGFDIPEFFDPSSHIDGVGDNNDEELTEERCVIKITFDNYERLDEFLDKYRDELVTTYKCNIAVIKR